MPVGVRLPVNRSLCLTRKWPAILLSVTTTWWPKVQDNEGSIEQLIYISVCYRLLIRLVPRPVFFGNTSKGYGGQGILLETKEEIENVLLKAKVGPPNLISNQARTYFNRSHVHSRKSPRRRPF